MRSKIILDLRVKDADLDDVKIFPWDVSTFFTRLLTDSRERIFPRKATYIARPFCDMLYWIIESKQYIASWICRLERVPN
jgi:hypothetical protein